MTSSNYLNHDKFKWSRLSAGSLCSRGWLNTPFFHLSKIIKICCVFSYPLLKKKTKNKKKKKKKNTLSREIAYFDDRRNDFCEHCVAWHAAVLLHIVMY